MLKLEEAVTYVKTNYILVGIGVLAVGILCYFMFSGSIPDNGSGIDKARTELSTAREQLDDANRKLAELQAGIDDLKRINLDLTNEISESRATLDSLGQANSNLTDEIDRISVLNQSSLTIVRDSQQGLRTVREAGPIRN